MGSVTRDLALRVRAEEQAGRSAHAGPRGGSALRDLQPEDARLLDAARGGDRLVATLHRCSRGVPDAVSLRIEARLTRARKWNCRIGRVALRAGGVVCLGAAARRIGLAHAASPADPAILPASAAPRELIAAPRLNPPEPAR